VTSVAPDVTESAIGGRDGGTSMATRARISITVTSTRGASQIRYNTVGRYVSTNVNTISDFLQDQPILTTASPEAFWTAVIAIVKADIAARGLAAGAGM